LRKSTAEERMVDGRLEVERAGIIYPILFLFAARSSESHISLPALFWTRYGSRYYWRVNGNAHITVEARFLGGRKRRQTPPYVTPKELLIVSEEGDVHEKKSVQHVG
jgi:hypothetical protein